MILFVPSIGADSFVFVPSVGADSCVFVPSIDSTGYYFCVCLFVEKVVIKLFTDGAYFFWIVLYAWDSGAQRAMVDPDCNTPYAWDSRALPCLVF